jgi:TetR/AcrR family transcriptional repressor of nem operon
MEIVRTLLGAIPGRYQDSGLVRRAWVNRALGRYPTVAHRDNPDGCPYPAVLSEIAAAPDQVRRAFAAALESRVKAFEAQVPPVEGATARERALATMALTIGGVLLSRAARGNPMSEEMLAACRKWALPEAEAGSTSAASPTRKR